MTIQAPATHTLHHASTTHLQRAVAIARTADLDGILNRARLAEGLPPLDAPRRGRPSKYVPYTPTALFAAIYEVAASGQSMSIKALLDAFWTRYTDTELALLGMDGLREPERHRRMFPSTNAMTTTEANRALAAAQRVFEAEYQRIVAALDNLFGVIDDTPLKMPRSTDGQPARRPTRQQVAQAAARPALKPRTAAKHEILNAIISAGLRVANQERHGHDDLFTGILADHKGHVAVDETHIIDALGTGLGRGVAPGNYLARIHGHTREGGKDGHRVAVGLTLGVAVADPSAERNLPEVCLGASIHHPTGGNGDAVRAILQAAQTNGLRPSTGSNAAERWIVDGGYAESLDLNRDLTTAGINMVFQYAKNRRVHFEVGGVNNPDGTRAAGVQLFNGAPLCPGASMRRLQELAGVLRKPEENLMSDAELQAHSAVVAELEPLRMRSNGRPQLSELRKRGGQRKDAPVQEPKKVMKVTLTCPMVSGTARCALFAEANHPDYAHLPEVPTPPVHLDPTQRPACCRNSNGSMVVNIDLDAYKTYQHDLMVGSFEHADWYTGPRSANERYNSLLKRAHSGGDLSRRSIAPRKAAFYALTLAASIAATNTRVLETFEAKAAMRGGVIPPPPGKANKRARERRLRNAQAAPVPRRSAA